MNPELLAFLNHHLFDIFRGIARQDKQAFHAYFKLLLFESACILSSFGEEPENCEPQARLILNQIIPLLTPQELPQIASEGAFVWWRKRFLAFLVPYYRDDGL
jgi:hypothetical protein